MAKENLIKPISQKDLLVYLCLRRYRNDITRKSSVPIAKLASITGASPVTILACLDNLSSQGFINIDRTKGRNFYSFLYDIEASSYEFLDSDLSFLEKSDIASEVSYIPGRRQKEDELSNLYDYIEDMKIKMSMFKQCLIETAEKVNTISKALSVITGQKYELIDTFNQD